MKTTIFSTLLASLAMSTWAQDVTTVNAASAEISDNLDLRAVASIFGDAANLEDFERRLNDPDLQISNLDLNDDNRVDYLRVVESVESNTHLIVLQSVLGQDVFQDVATIEVERDRNNNVQIQVVGDVYMYGPNYIYEPVYVTRPVIFASFWMAHYRPYCSSWYWGYYPTYYYAWNPYPVFRYRRNVHVHINVHNHYNYVNVRRSDRAIAMHNNRRSDGYARIHPTRSFQQRHNNVANRYELDQRRTIKDVGVRNGIAANNPRNTGNTRTESAPVRNNTVRNQGNASTRDNGIRNNPVRSESQTPRGNTRSESGSTRDNTPIRPNNPVRENNSIRTRENSVRENPGTRMESRPRATRSEAAPQRENRAPRIESAPRQSRMESPSRGNAGRSEAGAGRQERSRGNDSRR